MKGFLAALLVCALGFGVAPPLVAQDTFAGIDLLYPSLAHPHEDAGAAIKRRDFRFVTIDRYAREVPGLGKNQRLKWTYGTKFVRQPFRLFPSRSQNFSFNIRARAYAEEYNRVLLSYLLQRDG